MTGVTHRCGRGPPSSFGARRSGARRPRWPSGGRRSRSVSREPPHGRSPCSWNPTRRPSGSTPAQGSQLPGRLLRRRHADPGEVQAGLLVPTALQTVPEGCGFDIQRSRNAQKGDHAGVPLAALYGPQIRPPDPGLLCQRLLRPLLGGAREPDVHPDRGKRSLLVGGGSHSPACGRFRHRQSLMVNHRGIYV